MAHQSVISFLPKVYMAVECVEDPAVRGSLVSHAMDRVPVVGCEAALDELKTRVREGLWIELCPVKEQTEMLKLLASEDEVKELERIFNL